MEVHLLVLSASISSNNFLKAMFLICAVKIREFSHRPRRNARLNSTDPPDGPGTGLRAVADQRMTEIFDLLSSLPNIPPDRGHKRALVG